MSTEYTSRATIICPESLIDAGNQLALISGENAADVNTFTTASYEDTDGNLYAVCSTVVKPIFYTVQMGLPSELPEHALHADVELAQEALDNLVMWSEGDTFDSTKFTLIVNPDGSAAIALVGLTRIQTELV